MENASQQQSPPACQCQQQFGDALPWLAVVLAIVVGVDRFRRRGKKNGKPGGTTGGGSDDGNKT